MDKHATKHPPFNVYSVKVQSVFKNCPHLAALVEAISPPGDFCMSPQFQVKNSNYDLVNTLLSLLLYFTTFTQILHATAIFYNNSQIRTATFRSTFAAISSRP